MYPLTMKPKVTQMTHKLMKIQLNINIPTILYIFSYIFDICQTAKTVIIDRSEIITGNFINSHTILQY